MNKLYPLLLEHRLPAFARYGIAVSITLVCAVLQVALQMLTGSPGFFLLPLGVFLSGLIFDRGRGFLLRILPSWSALTRAIKAGTVSTFLRPTVFSRSRRQALLWPLNSYGLK